MKKIRILIIEDNRLLREGITSMIEEQPDLKAAASYADAKDIKKIREAKPNIVLLDIGLRSQNSLQIVKLFKKEFPEVKIILMDLVPLEMEIMEFIRAGVTGFILKDASVYEFLKTIRSVAAGAKVLPPNLTGSLFSQIVDNAIKKEKSSVLKESVSMTKRERQVIELIADGLTNKEIAQRLHLSPHTVKSHVHNILDKLALHTRVQIAKYSHEINYTIENISLLKDE
ncbi:MAG: response regulator transcription factor [Ignavibacteriaceae bacterium]